MISRIFIIGLFFLNAGLYFFNSHLPELRGDETTAYIALYPFIYKLLHFEFYPSFLTFYHEPLQLISQLPVIFFGASESLARLPNILSGIATFYLLYKLSSLIFKQRLYILFILLAYTLNASFLVYRLTLDLGLFVMLMTIFVYLYCQTQSGNRNRFINKSLVALVLAIYTFIDGIFVLFGLVLATFVWPNKLLRKNSVLAVAVVLLSLLVWFCLIYFTSTYTRLFDWKLVAPARLFLRGSNFSPEGIIKNWQALSQYIHPSFLLFLVFFLPFSFKELLAKKLWVIFLPSLIFFNLVKNPTQHLFNFWPVLIILSTFGVKNFLQKFPYLKISVLAVFVATMSVNFYYLYFKATALTPANYKIAGTFIQSHTPFCSPIYTNLDGYVFRFYFNRPYVKNLSSFPQFAVIEDSSEQLNQLKSKGYNTLAKVSSFPQDIIIMKKNYLGKTIQPEKINKVNFEFSRLLDYTVKCSS